MERTVFQKLDCSSHQPWPAQLMVRDAGSYNPTTSEDHMVSIHAFLSHCCTVQNSTVPIIPTSSKTQPTSSNNGYLHTCGVGWPCTRAQFGCCGYKIRRVSACVHKLVVAVTTYTYRLAYPLAYAYIYGCIYIRQPA